MDLFTKYLSLYPLEDHTAKTVAWNIQNNFVCQHGAPEQPHSDQGKNLNVKTIEEVCDYLQTWKTQMTLYRPQSDGKSERTIRTVVNMLSKYVSEAQDDWDDFINHISLAYNSSINESTSFTPYFMVHGRKV